MDQTLIQNSLLHLKRGHTHLGAQLLIPHQVLSTCACQGGLRSDLTHIVNHQSCEGSAAHPVAANLHKISRQEHHQQACNLAQTPPQTTALLGTAANMQCAGIAQEEFENTAVLAIATAGVEGNAGRVGDPARWHEGERGWQDTHALGGTINILVFFDAPLSPAALVRAAATLTEAKTSVLQDLSVGSRNSCGLATGTGTDQFAIAAPIGTPRFTWTGHHAKLGELLGNAVRSAVAQSLAWQNGLEPTRTRSLVHALGRYGLSREVTLKGLQELTNSQTIYLQSSLDMVLHDPQVACIAHGLATLFDRGHAGVIPATALDEALVRQCALLVCAVGGKDEKFSLYLQQLQKSPKFPAVILQALVLGWSEKWTQA